MDPALKVRVHERREALCEKFVPHGVEAGEDEGEERLLREGGERRAVLAIVERDELVDGRCRARIARVDATSCALASINVGKGIGRDVQRAHPRRA